MRWRVATTLGLVMMLSLSFLPTSAALALGAQAVDSQDKELARQKLDQEIQKLELENDQLRSWWSRYSLGPVIGAIAGLLTLYLTLRKQLQDVSDRRREETAQRAADSQRRFDERFTVVVENLGSDSIALRAQSAASLRTFLRPKSQAFHEDVFVVLVANLKIQQNRVVRDLLVRVFSDAVRLKLERVSEPGANARSMDLSRAALTRVDLSSLDFQRFAVDVAFADLRDADLTDSKLRRLRGIGVNLTGARLSRGDLMEARLNEANCQKAQFHETNLVSATLKGAKLRRAEFQRARLQSAHLESSDLRGARFEEANLADTYFNGCRFDDAALRSMTRALKWRAAHFDEKTRTRLSQLE